MSSFAPTEAGGEDFVDYQRSVNHYIDDRLEDRLIAEAIGVLQSEDFMRGYVAIQTQGARASLAEAEEVPVHYARQRVKGELTAQAHVLLRRIYGPSFDEAPSSEKGEQISSMRATISNHKIDWQGEMVTFSDYLFQRMLPIVKQMPKFAPDIEAAHHDLEMVIGLTEDNVRRFWVELDRYYQTYDFREAAKLWLNTPDADGDLGILGAGYNGGLIHLLRYQGVEGKSNRFKRLDGGDTPLSVQWFIDTSFKYHDLLTDIHNPDSYAAVLEDRVAGHHRYYVLTSEGVLLIGFHHALDMRFNPDSSPRLATIMTGEEADYFESRVENCLNGQDMGVLNILGQDVELIHMHRPVITKEPPVRGGSA